MKKSSVLAAACAAALITVLITGYTSRKTSAHTAKIDSTGNKSSFYFLFLSDVHLATNSLHSQYGQDAGIDLWNACKPKIDSILKSPDPPAFILYTGDLPQHGGNYNPAQRAKNIDSLLSDLHRMSAVKHIPLFYMPGNNDALGGDYCFFTDANGKTPFSLTRGYAPYPYQAFNVSDKPVSNGACMISDSNLAAGYYSARIMKGLRIISLNSVLWSNQLCNNCIVPANCNAQQSAGAQEMTWLKNQLADAANAGEKVYIAMHVPPGADAYSSRNSPYNPVMMWKGSQDKSGWQNMFLQAVSAYRQTIAGIFFGHTHMDEFRLLYDDSSNNIPMQVAISCPGISPIFGNNPGFKLVTVDADSKFPMDFITYYTTVNPIIWQQPYQFSQLSGAKPGVSIFQALKQMTPVQRKNVLNAIYTVKHGSIKNAYDTLGMTVRPVK